MVDVHSADVNRLLAMVGPPRCGAGTACRPETIVPKGSALAVRLSHPFAKSPGGRGSRSDGARRPEDGGEDLVLVGIDDGDVIDPGSAPLVDILDGSWKSGGARDRRADAAG